jgi:hypothetical protein
VRRKTIAMHDEDDRRMNDGRKNGQMEWDYAMRWKHEMRRVLATIDIRRNIVR